MDKIPAQKVNLGSHDSTGKENGETEQGEIDKQKIPPSLSEKKTAARRTSVSAVLSVTTRMKHREIRNRLTNALPGSHWGPVDYEQKPLLHDSDLRSKAAQTSPAERLYFSSET